MPCPIELRARVTFVFVRPLLWSDSTGSGFEVVGSDGPPGHGPERKFELVSSSRELTGARLGGHGTPCSGSDTHRRGLSVDRDWRTKVSLYIWNWIVGGKNGFVVWLSCRQDDFA